MRKNIIISAVLVLFVGMTSCSGWLDVKPKKTVEEEELFSREIGFKEALTAAYIKMANTNLYAKNLSYGFIDILGQRYENGKELIHTRMNCIILFLRKRRKSSRL